MKKMLLLVALINSSSYSSCWSKKIFKNLIEKPKKLLKDNFVFILPISGTFISTYFIIKEEKEKKTNNAVQTQKNNPWLHIHL